jgi:hypothetical protein
MIYQTARNITFWFWVVGLVSGLGLLSGCESGGSGGGGAFQGTYAGSYSGSFGGTWQITVDSGGTAAGAAISVSEDVAYEISGSVDDGGQLEAGMYRESLYFGTFNGVLVTNGTCRGTWLSSDGAYGGRFVGEKLKVVIQANE